MAYNVAKITITNANGDDYNFEMQSYSLSDPQTVTSRYGQYIVEGVGDPWNLTGEANFSYGLRTYLQELARTEEFFTLTTTIQIRLQAGIKRVYSECKVSSDVYESSLDRGAEDLITINFSLNRLESETVVPWETA